MIRNDLPAQAANVKQAVESWATCTSATADSLRACLLTAKPANLQKKSTLGASQRHKAKPSNVQGPREGKRSKKNLGAKFSEGPVNETAAQERWILATAVVNTVLRVLTESMRNVPIEKVECGRFSHGSISCSVARPESSNKDTAIPLQPISINRLSVVSEEPQRSKYSSCGSASNQKQGLRAQAECARIAFAALRSMHLHDGLGVDMPPLQLETGMSALVGKLIAFGLDDLAAKELRILKRRLDRFISLSAARGSGTVDAKKSQADDAPPTSKESLDSLLSFITPIDKGLLLGLVITSQLQALKLIHALGNSGTIDASLKHLRLCCPYSPANFIALQVDKPSTESKIKSARQLESLSQSLLALSSSLSTVPEGGSAGLRRVPSSTTAFELKIAALEIRLRRWILLGHKPNMNKDIIEPFALYIDTLNHQCSLTSQQTYSICRTACQRLSKTAENLASNPREQLWLDIYPRLADLARESSQYDEALHWLQCAMKFFPKTEIGSSKYCAISCRITNIRLEAHVATSDCRDLLVALKDARDSLKGNLRGEPTDFDDLLTIICFLRKSAFSVLHGYQNSPSQAELKDRSEIIDLCSDLIVLSLKFLVRYVKSMSKTEKAGSRFNQQMQLVWNNARLFLESVSAITRYSVITQMHNWETLENGLRDCALVAITLSDLRSIGSPSSFGQDLKELSVIPISNAYWCRYLYLKQKGDTSQELRENLHKAIDLLTSRPTEEKLNGLLPAKLEKLGLLYEVSKEYAKAASTYAEALQLLMKSNILKAAAIACARLPVAEVLDSVSEYSILGRLLLSHTRAGSKMDHLFTERGLYFDDESLSSSERGLILEQQLIALSSMTHKHGPSSNICKMLQGISVSLLTVYQDSQFPVRRLRVVVILLQLRSTYPIAIDVSMAEQLLKHQWKSPGTTSLELDADLHRFVAHLLQCRDLYVACLETTVNVQVLEENLALWFKMLQDGMWDSVHTQVDDVAQWILQLEFLAEYLELKGLDLLRVQILQLIAVIQDLRRPIEPPAVLSSFSSLASLYARLGYATRAADALQSAMKYGDTEALPEVMISWNLACAEVTMNSGNIVRAQEHLDKAHMIFKRTAGDKNAYDSRFRKSLKTIQLMSDMNYVSSLLAMKKDEFSKAFFHARLHLKLGYRAWTAIESHYSKTTQSKLTGDELSDTDGDDVANRMSTLSLAKPELSSINSRSFPVPHNVSLWSTSRRLFHGLVHLSQLFAHWGLFPEARYHIEQGLKVIEAAHAPCLKSQALGYLGDYLTRNRDIEQGRDLLKQAEDTRPDLQFDSHMVSLYLFKANCYMYEKDTKSVCNALHQASKVLEQLMMAPLVKQSISQPAVIQDISAEMSQLSLNSVPSTRRLQTKTRAAGKNGGGKSANGAKVPISRVLTVASSGISILSHLKATILRQQASMATSMDKFELAASLLSEAGDIPSAPHDIVFNKIGACKLHFRQAIEAMAADPVFCVLPESTTSQPCISAARGRQGASASERSPIKQALCSPPRSAAVKKASRDTRVGHAVSPVRFLEHLSQAHEDILSVYEQAKTGCSTTIIHTLTDLLTRTNAMLSASAGSQAKAAPNTMFVLYVMELGKMVSMMRAKLAVQVERQVLTHRALPDWPSRDIGDDFSSTAETAFDFSTFQSLYIDIIPLSWTVLSISLSESQDEVRVTRVRSGQSPFILSLPLKRHNFRDPEEECFGFKSARDELDEIVSLANFSAHDAQDMSRKGARSEWWEVRTALDTRLHDLLVNIENFWLGGFRGIFSQHSYRPELLSRFQQSLQNILNKHLPSRQKQGRAKVAGRVTLDPRVLELFIGLGMPTELNDLDEALMDLLYFVIDILQFHGEHNAYDEIDFDSISIEIIDALHHYHKAVVNDEGDDRESKHTILILDKALHCFPWESLPCLREHAISRLPSLACLRDRILQQQQQQKQQQQPNIKPERMNEDGLQVDRRSGAAILNPAADLTATQAVFEPALAQLHDWGVVIQRPPGEEEMKSCLENHDVFLYFGHGSGAQYIRSRTIKKLDKCAVTLLMGCSSGVLTEAGEFEPYGTPFNYIQGGCPALVANLWDVTDKDIDQFSYGVLTSWGLFQQQKQQDNKVLLTTTTTSNSNGSPVKRSTRHRAQNNHRERAERGDLQRQQLGLALPAPAPAVSLDQAVAQSRDLCKLKYLNGAAPVVYGVPVFLV